MPRTVRFPIGDSESDPLTHPEVGHPALRNDLNSLSYMFTRAPLTNPAFGPNDSSHQTSSFPTRGPYPSPCDFRPPHAMRLPSESHDGYIHATNSTLRPQSHRIESPMSRLALHIIDRQAAAMADRLCAQHAQRVRQLPHVASLGQNEPFPLASQRPCFRLTCRKAEAL